MWSESRIWLGSGVWSLGVWGLKSGVWALAARAFPIILRYFCNDTIDVFYQILYAWFRGLSLLATLRCSLPSRLIAAAISLLLLWAGAGAA